MQGYKPNWGCGTGPGSCATASPVPVEPQLRFLWNPTSGSCGTPAPVPEEPQLRFLWNLISGSCGTPFPVPVEPHFRFLWNPSPVPVEPHLRFLWNSAHPATKPKDKKKHRGLCRHKLNQWIMNNYRHLYIADTICTSIITMMLI